MASFPGVLPGLPFAEDLGQKPDRATLSGAPNVLETSQLESPRAPIGVFGEHPGMTPKYARNRGLREADFRETMARMFIEVGPNEYEKFVDAVSREDPEAEPLARILAGVSSGGGAARGGTGYIDFLLQNVQSGFTERMEVVETLGDNYVAYFFGEGAPTFSYSGTLLNTVQDDQAQNMLRIYQSMIRGSQLARRNKTLRLRYNEKIVIGAVTGITFAENSENETAIPFSFQVLVKRVIQMTNNKYGLVQLTEPFGGTPEAAETTTSAVPKELSSELTVLGKMNALLT